MAFALIAMTSAGSANSTSVTTSPINTTGANLIVISVSSYSLATAPDFLDSKGNTWTALTAKTSSTCRSRLFYRDIPTTDAAHTFTAQTGVTYPSIAVAAFSGSLASPFDQESGAFNNSSVTSIQPGSITPSQGNCLLIAGITGYGTSQLINSGFTASTVDVGGSLHFAGGIAYKIKTDSLAENPTWSWTTAAEVATVMASFKAAVTGAKRRRLMTGAR